MLAASFFGRENFYVCDFVFSHRFLIFGLLKTDNSDKASNKSVFLTQPSIRNHYPIDERFGFIV